jgi:hypothetical protein
MSPPIPAYQAKPERAGPAWSQALAPPESLARIPRPGGWLKFDAGWLQPEQAIRNLETSVSLLQTASHTLDEIDGLITRVLAQTNLAWREGDRSRPPPGALGEELGQVRHQVDEWVRRCRFHGRGLLDGQSGVAGLGNGVAFIRGGPNTLTSPPEGYAVRIQGFPSRASLTGGVTLHDDWLRAEQEVFLAEGDHFVRCAPKGDEGVQAFVARLQDAVLAAGLDLEIGITRQQRLLVRHNQYGSHFKFKGSSRKTPILSKRPGRIEWSRPGRDIQGTLDGESAFGIGRMLVGYLDNPHTSELAVLWRGGALHGGTEGRVHVVQNGIVFQERQDMHQPLVRLTLPALYTFQLGAWLETRSGFTSLNDVRLNTWPQVQDALNLLFAVSCELEDWRERLDGWIKRYQNQALRFLRQNGPDETFVEEAGEELKAEDMARVLRRWMEQGPPDGGPEGPGS